jgi:phosphatidate cytidylyltransferase
MFGNLAAPTDNATSLLTPALLLYGFLAFASLVAVYKTRAIEVSQLRQQVFSWWYLFPIITAALYFYPYGISMLALLICGLTARELDRHVANKNWQFHLFCTALLCLMFSLNYFSSTWFFRIIPCLLLIQLLLFAIKRSVNYLLPLLFILSCFSIGLLVQYTKLPMAKELSLFWLAYLFVVTALNDVAQYIFGTRFGKQKIAVHISPNKTWQGLAGGVLISVLVSMALGHYLALGSVLVLALLGFVLSLGGFIGDMLFSAAKRFLSIKDFSNLIPGHGGILDRVDSLVITAPLLYLVLHTPFFGSHQ